MMRAVCWLCLALLMSVATGRAAILNLERFSGKARLSVSSVDMPELAIESCARLGQWENLVTLNATNRSGSWIDDMSTPNGFYRLADPGTTRGFAAQDFRLIDQSGFSRELYYHFGDPQVSAIVLIFVFDGVAELAGEKSYLADLEKQFAPKKARFWVINEKLSENRATSAKAMQDLGLSWPVMLDRAGTIRRAYSVTRSRSAFLIDTRNAVVMYQGALGPYLYSALNAFYASTPISPSSVRAGGQFQAIEKQPVSYARDVAPILIKHCVRCHSDGNIAPWSMSNYEMIRSYSRPIQHAVLSKEMPPWHADPENGSFSNDNSLTPAEERALLDWIRQGSPRGDGNDPLPSSLPPAPKDWPAELGAPDLVLTIPAQTIPAQGVVAYRYLQVPNPLTTNAWLRAAVVRPGNRRVVHHANVSLGDVNRYLSIYVPGQDAVAFPEGTGRFLPAKTNILFQMHYISVGVEQTEQTQLGLYLASQPPQRNLQTYIASANDISIPPGAREYLRDAELNFNKKVMVYELYAHMHYRGARMKFEAFYPDGTSEVLLSVPKYEFHWQTLYRLAQPKVLPANTRVRVTGAFDNSAQNVENPDPSRWVYNGEQTWDEMFIGFLHCADIP